MCFSQRRFGRMLSVLTPRCLLSTRTPMVFSRRGKKKKQKAPVEKGTEAAKPKARVGVTSGVGVGETWIRVFERNEQCDQEDRLTDEQISESMKSEFPDLDAVTFDRVEIARGKYNRGGFHKKDKNGKVVRPKIHSNPHGTQAGSPAADRPGPRPTDAAPMKQRVVSTKKDFKAHKK